MAILQIHSDAVNGASMNICDDRNGYVALRASRVPIIPGEIFTITANDSKDMPSVELLQLRWKFDQIAAFAGFTNLTDDDIHHEDDLEDNMLNDRRQRDGIVDMDGEWDDEVSYYALDEIYDDDDTR
ncbi:hypothetical protein Sste5346_009969 [Sporothrix stenoceras]|uniref:Uncharacterized protein n=1 Tax=Sporothrix stenoceras TaxID=5173 RepID=A0ABR3YIF1_9PEZI